jgi:putative superfamily III holin-X
MMAGHQDDRSLGDLLAELSRETAQLVRKEVELATTEITSKAKTAASGAGIAAAGGALMHAGLLVLLAAIVIGLAQIGVAPWLSALLVAVVTMIVGYVLVNKGLVQVKRTGMTPTQTIETLKETATWTTRQGA